MRQLQLLSVLSLIAAAFWAKRASGAEQMPRVGQPAPEFQLPSQDGSVVDLRQFRGKWVVLYFYPKDNTPGCTIEAHRFQSDLTKYQQHNAVILGVSLDSAASHKDFCARQGLSFKLLADTDNKVAALYGSLRNLLVVKMAARNTFLIDPQGRIAKVWIGVDPSHHSEDVLAALADAGASSHAGAIR